MIASSPLKNKLNNDENIKIYIAPESVMGYFL